MCAFKQINTYRYYDPYSQKFLSEDPIGFRGRDVNLYRFVYNNPLKYSDPFGLEVMLCKRPAQIAGGAVDHHWIKTDTVEAGMGNAGGNVPGNQVDSPFVTETEIVDHSGQSKLPGSTCTKVNNVDERKVNEQLKIGKKLGTWTPANQCQSFTEDVLKNAEYDWTRML